MRFLRLGLSSGRVLDAEAELAETVLVVAGVGVVVVRGPVAEFVARANFPAYVDADCQGAEGHAKPGGGTQRAGPVGAGFMVFQKFIVAPHARNHSAQCQQISCQVQDCIHSY